MPFETIVKSKFLLPVLLSLLAPAMAEPPVPTRISDVIVTQDSFSKPVSYGEGLNGLSFQQDALLTHKGWQYAAFYNAARHVCVSRRKLPDGAWQVLELKDYTQATDDSHNTISLGVCDKDGTLHLSFDHHGDDLNYRKSAAGLASNPETAVWNAAQFGPTLHQLTGPTIAITYPRFQGTASGKLLMEFRIGNSGNGDSYIYEYDGAAGKWSVLGSDSRYIQGADNNAYVNGFDFDSKGRLHVTWCWRENTDVVSNHGLIYVYSDDDGRTWKNNAGTAVGQIGSKPVSPATAGIEAWNIPQNAGLINQEAQAVDPQDRIHAFLRTDSTVNGAKKPFHTHFWRDENGKWTRINTRIPSGSPTSDRAKIAFDADGNAYAMLPDFRVASASAAAKWTDWKVTYAASPSVHTMEPLYDRVRLAQDGILSVFWQEVTTTGRATLRVQDFKLAAATSRIQDPHRIGRAQAAAAGTGAWGRLWNAMTFGLDGRLRK